jgi:inositol-pentakisphosphate 2-kinase
MAVCLSETSPAEWKYISEGGATIVFSYRGPCHPILTGRVLRLSKTPCRGGGTSLRVSNDQTRLAAEFQQKIISRLLHPSHLVDLQAVPLESQWLEAFAIYHELSRPQERRSTSNIDRTNYTGFLAPDLMSGLSCAVEIKVNSNHYPEELNENIPKSRNGVSSLILSTCRRRPCLSRLGLVGLVCMPI